MLAVQSIKNCCMPQGIKEAAHLPPAVTEDPDVLSEEERRKLGIVRLPATLDEVYAALEEDTGEEVYPVHPCMLMCAWHTRQEFGLFAMHVPSCSICAPA